MADERCDAQGALDLTAVIQQYLVKVLTDAIADSPLLARAPSLVDAAITEFHTAYRLAVVQDQPALLASFLTRHDQARARLITLSTAGVATTNTPQ